MNKLLTSVSSLSDGAWESRDAAVSARSRRSLEALGSCKQEKHKLNAGSSEMKQMSKQCSDFGLQATTEEDFTYFLVEMI